MESLWVTAILAAFGLDIVMGVCYGHSLINDLPIILIMWV